MSLIPLFLALIFSVATAMQVFKRKSMAQSHCIRQATETQNRLRGILIRLLKLNPQARVLRARRLKADRAVKVAEAGKYPPAIAIARAAQAAAILQQLALKTKQNALLQEAANGREESFRQLRSRLESLHGTSAKTVPLFPLALAVVPKPPASLTPDYEPAPRFTFLQQQNFKFDVDLYPDSDWVQPTVCSVSLEASEGNKWKIRVLAANASWN